MTTEEKLQIITDRIRKDIPRLMELSEGCYIKVLKGKNKNEIFKTISPLTEDDNIYAIHYINHNNDIKYLEINNFEIIGHEPMLNDVLEWLNTKVLLDILSNKIEYTGYYGVCNKFIILSENDCLFITHFEQHNNRLGKWDLSKPYLKDQNGEFISFIYELVKKNK